MAINHEVLLAPSGYRPGMQLNTHKTAPPQRTGIETNVDHALGPIPKTVGEKTPHKTVLTMQIQFMVQRLVRHGPKSLERHHTSPSSSSSVTHLQKHKM